MRTAPVSSENQSITAAEFKAKCLQLMDQVSESKRFVVTKRGKPVAQLIGPPVAEPKPFCSIVGRSPHIEVPTPKEWAKIKAQAAEDWADPVEKLTRVTRKHKAKKGKKA